MTPSGRGLAAVMAGSTALLVLAILVAGTHVPPPPPASAGRVEIVDPPAGAVVAAGVAVPVRVRVDGPIAKGPEDDRGGHLRLDVDGDPQYLPYTARATISLTPGQHRVAAVYLGNDFAVTDPEVRHEIVISAE